MIELLALLGSSFVVGLTGALMPGPVLSVTIDEAVRGGFFRGFRVSLGHATLEFVIVVALILGLGEFLRIDVVSGSVGLLGGSFLIFMGYLITVEAVKGPRVTASGRGGMAGLEPTVSGILTSLSNPYWLIWWVTTGSAYLVFSFKYGLLGVLVFYLGHISSDLGWYGLVSFATARKKAVIGGWIYRMVLGVCGVFLLLLGIYFIFYGLNSLLCCSAFSTSSFNSTS